MDRPLGDLQVLTLDCQASGSSPAYGDLLELGWATCTGGGLAGQVHSRWIVPRTDRPIPMAVRELTGWTKACVADAVDERQAFGELRAALAPGSAGPSPTVIHFARFELAFLRDLWQRLDGTDRLPLDVVCLHAIAARLFPELPRRNIRALAGYLGHSPDLVRRAAGHVEASAFIWGALLPRLAARSVRTWRELKAWLDQPAPRPPRGRRLFPFAPERRRALPAGPGVYRFLRRNGDVLYVGKAAHLRSRVGGHFRGGGPANERALELLTQVHDVVVTETASALEAALLEADEIKRLDPPYNVHLRAVGRQVWFASRDLLEVAPAPDAGHPIGPLPSERALAPLAALAALADGGAPTPPLCAAALGVPAAFLPDPALFEEGFRGFLADPIAGEGDRPEPTALARLARASRALWLLRGRAEPEPDGTDGTPSAGPAEAEVEWDLARVRRRLERSLVQTGLLLRRARFLCLLAEATVAVREPEMAGARVLVISGGRIEQPQETTEVGQIASWAARACRGRAERQACFDAGVYDRLRVLATELKRVRKEGGEAALRLGRHVLLGDRLSRVLSAI